MKSLRFGLLTAFALMSLGCGQTQTPPPPAASSPAPSAVAAVPDADAGQTLSWQKFSAPDGAFTVEAPAPMKESAGAPGMHRYQTPVLAQHAQYDVGWMEISAKDRGAPRPVIARAFADGLSKGVKVKYRQAGMFLGAYPSEMMHFDMPDGRQVEAQVFVGQDRIWVMQVLVPGTVRDLSKIPSHRFMASITVKDPPPGKAGGSPSPTSNLDSDDDAPSGQPAASR